MRIQWGLPENGGSGGILRWAPAATAKSQGSLHNPRAVSWACSRPRSVSRRGQGRGPAGGCGRPAGRGGGRRPGGRAGWGGRGPRSGEGGGRVGGSSTAAGVGSTMEWGGRRARGGELDGSARGGRSTATDGVGREWSGEEWRNGQSQPAAYLFCGLFAECRPDTTLGNVFKKKFHQFAECRPMAHSVNYLKIPVLP